MNTWMISWSDFTGADGFVDAIVTQLTTANLIGILSGLVGVTIGFTLIYRFSARIRTTIIGAMTNSRRRR